MRSDTTKNDVEEVLGHIRRLTYHTRDEFDADRFVLNLKNGFLYLRDYVLKPHSPGYLSLVRLPVAYDQGATCPEIEKFMGQVMFADDVNLAQEWFGFCLWREYTIKKALLLVGEGNNGKSVWLDVLRAFLGQENVTARSLQELETNRFAKADLYMRLACIFADLPDIALRHTGTFKLLTGRDLLTAERKFRNGFPFENFAKLSFSCNKIPETRDDTDAFFLRWLILTFPNTFSGDSDRKRLIDKLTTPEELSGLFNGRSRG